jgi:putative tryptophan/tyrosine transport system substrate-binding protein
VKRREFITLLGGAAAAWPLAARAQQATAMPVVGFLNSGSPSGRANFVAAFRRGLREIGYVEGQNVALEYRWANDQYDRLPELAADLVRRQVSVIAAIGTSAPGLAARAATSVIPIVFQTGGDPIKDGLVTSMNRPSGNVTGTSIFATGLEGKRFNLLHEVVPRSATIAVLLNRDSVAAEAQSTDIQTTAHALQRQVRVLNASTDQDIDAVFATIVEEKLGGLHVTSDLLFNSQHRRIVTLANRQLLPAIYPFRFFCLAGGVMSYGTDLADGYRHTGVYVGRILKGEKPADLPVLQSIKFEFVINLATVKALDLNIPPGVLAIVDEVIE